MSFILTTNMSNSKSANNYKRSSRYFIHPPRKTIVITIDIPCSRTRCAVNNNNNSRSVVDDRDRDEREATVEKVNSYRGPWTVENLAHRLETDILPRILEEMSEDAFLDVDVNNLNHRLSVCPFFRFWKQLTQIHKGGGLYVCQED